MMTAEAVGPTVTHFFGAKGKATHGRPPRYVWVPTRIAERGETPTRNVEEFRTIFAWAEHCEVYVWGRSFAEVSALRRNLLVALGRSAFADVAVEGGRYARPGEAWNQDGELFVLEFSIRVPIPDEFVEIADVLTEPEVGTVVPTEITGDIHNSPDTETDGELGVSVSTSP